MRFLLNNRFCKISTARERQFIPLPSFAFTQLTKDSDYFNYLNFTRDVFMLLKLNGTCLGYSRQCSDRRVIYNAFHGTLQIKNRFICFCSISKTEKTAQRSNKKCKSGISAHNQCAFFTPVNRTQFYSLSLVCCGQHAHRRLILFRS